MFAHPSSKRLDEWQVRSRSFVFVAGTAQDDSAIDRGLYDDFAGEASLTGARLAAQQEAMASSFSRSTPKLTRFSQLFSAPDKSPAR